MYIYLIIFFISFIIAIFAEKKYKKNKRLAYIVLSIIAIAIPALMAGLRESGIGTDTQVYVDWVFRECVHFNSLKDIVNFSNNSGVEFLYCLTNFIVSRFSNDLSVMYFILEFIFLFLSYFACVKLSKKINFSFSFAYFIILVLFFNKSLNLCRQSLAMSMCLFSFSYILQRDWKKFFLIIIIAFGFHKSVILFIPLYFIYNLNINETRLKIMIKILIVMLLCASVLFFKQIVISFVNLGLLSSKYLNYIYRYGTTNNIKIIEILFQLIIIIVSIFFRKNLIEKSEYNKLLIYIIILSFVTFLFGFNAMYSQRISYYFSFFISLVIPQVVMLFKSRKDKLLLSGLLVLILCTYSYVYYEKYRFDQTIPYKIDNNKVIK